MSSEDKVIQSPPSLVVHEGDNSTLSCSYKVTSFQSLFWFKQEEKTPTFLLRLISGGTEKSGRLKGTLDKKELLSTLHITTTQLGDSATYLCAAEAQCRLVSCSPYQMLQLRLLQLLGGELAKLGTTSKRSSKEKQLLVNTLVPVLTITGVVHGVISLHSPPSLCFSMGVNIVNIFRGHSDDINSTTTPLRPVGERKPFQKESTNNWYVHHPSWTLPDSVMDGKSSLFLV